MSRERIERKSLERLDESSASRSVSRRQFIKAVGGLSAIIGAGSLGIVAEMNNWSLQKMLYEYTTYGSDTFKQIGRVEEKLGLNLPMPLKEHLSGPNTPWEKGELVMLDHLTKKVPGIYKRSRRITSLQRYETDSKHYGAVAYGSAKIVLFAPKIYNPTQQSQFPELWPTSIQSFEGIMVHELTHKLLDERPVLLKDYAKATGWVKQRGGWVHGGNLGVVDKYVNRSLGPSEDAANAASIFTTAREKLQTGKTEDNIRVNFIRANFR